MGLIGSAIAYGVMFVYALVVRLRRGAASRPRAVGGSGVWVISNAIVDMYAVRVSGGVVLFDTGLDPRGRAVDRLLAALDATRDDVTDVFLTHAHPDHVGGAALLPRARVHAGAADAAFFERRAGFRHGAVRLFGRLVPAPPVRVDDRVDAEREIPVGDGTERVRAIPMPGDTPGALAFLVRRVLVVGDGFVRRGDSFTLSPSWTLEDPEANARSVVRLLGRARELAVTHVCTSHGGVGEGGLGGSAFEGLAREARARAPEAA
ncbi:MAG: MBL fold metallo-hydrolase [Myxococcales bacterium]|nr:MBL fold metallo-hydrolase [Myxococcales bacterium]